MANWEWVVFHFSMEGTLQQPSFAPWYYYCLPWLLKTLLVKNSQWTAPSLQASGPHHLPCLWPSLCSGATEGWMSRGCTWRIMAASSPFQPREQQAGCHRGERDHWATGTCRSGALEVKSSWRCFCGWRPGPAHNAVPSGDLPSTSKPHMCWELTHSPSRSM